MALWKMRRRMNEVWRHWCGGSKFKTVEITSRMSSMSPSAHTYVLLRPKILELAKLRLSLAKPSEPCNFDSLAHVGVIVQRHDHNDEDSRELRVLWQRLCWVRLPVLGPREHRLRVHPAALPDAADTLR